MKKITKGVVMAVAAALLLFGCKNPTRWVGAVLESEEGNSDDVLIENGKYISATGTSDGIKITFADNVRIIDYNSISVDGIPIRIDVTQEDANRKEYVFPFAEEGKTYTVTYDGKLIVDGVNIIRVKDSVECVAGGGWLYTDYLNIYPLNRYTLTVSYNPNDKGKIFSGMFTPYFTKDDVILNDEIFSGFTFGYSVVLGEVNWTHTAYWTWTRRDNWESSSIFDDALSEGFDFYSGEDKVPTAQDWSDYDYKYAAYATPSFTLKNYPGTSFFVVNDLWSEQEKL